MNLIAVLNFFVTWVMHLVVFDANEDTSVGAINFVSRGEYIVPNLVTCKTWVRQILFSDDEVDLIFRAVLSGFWAINGVGVKW